MASTALREALDRFAEREPGVRSFETLANECRRLGSEDSANAVHFTLVGLAAQQFYDAFEGQPLPVEEAYAAKERLLAAARESAQALSADAETKLAALNRLAQMILRRD